MIDIDTDIISFSPEISEGQSTLYGAEYQTDTGPLSSLYDHNVPCVVCYVSTRVSYLMIPAKVCP